MMDTIKLDITPKGIATVTLNRAEVHNAFNDALIQTLSDTFEALEAREDVRVIILTGDGKSFSAGADLNWMKAAANYSYDENVADASRLSKMFDRINGSNKPVIGLVNGAAFGGGIGLVSVCDMVVAVETAKFCLSEVRLGLSPATISPFVLAKIGVSAARRYFLTAERFDAKQAKKIGLIHEVASDQDAAKQIAIEWCEALIAGAPNAITASKRLALDFADQPITDELRADSADRIAKRRTSAEGREGVGAFLKKRSPNWITKGSDNDAE